MRKRKNAGSVEIMEWRICQSVEIDHEGGLMSISGSFEVVLVDSFAAAVDNASFEGSACNSSSWGGSYYYCYSHHPHHHAGSVLFENSHALGL